MFKLIATMRRGSATGIAATWARYETIEAARIGTATLFRDDRVMRVRGMGGTVTSVRLVGSGTDAVTRRPFLGCVQGFFLRARRSGRNPVSSSRRDQRLKLANGIVVVPSATSAGSLG
jgi:hypothetical protein